MNFTKKTTDGEKWRYYSKTKPHIEKEEPKPDTTREVDKFVEYLKSNLPYKDYDEIAPFKVLLLDKLLKDFKDAHI